MTVTVTDITTSIRLPVSFSYPGGGDAGSRPAQRAIVDMDWMSRSQTNLRERTPGPGETRVLVVDDNPAVCRLAAEIAEGLGLEAVVADGPAGFLRRYEEALLPSCSWTCTCRVTTAWHC
ncbi:hypothetical protein ACFOGJ_12390 [Marinibaculum pumilum]|uniref:Response regulator n=1 Tax=Marinibaculum pumilum TaxID=1766165 RepID=A0ABV7L0C9_9PROT